MFFILNINIFVLTKAFLLFYMIMLMLEKDRTLWSKMHPFQAQMMSIERVTDEDHWQDVRLIKFDISGSNIRYIVSYS